MRIITRPISPKALKTKPIYDRLVGAVLETVNDAYADFAKTYETWEHKPTFTRSVKALPQAIIGETATTDINYVRLNNGTPEHAIPKAGPGLLVFSEGYTAKTAPGVLSSKAGGPYGKKVIIIKQVHHPGTKARKWDLAVRKRQSPKFTQRVKIALEKGAKESGNAIT